MIVLAAIAFLLSGLLYIWIAAILLYPIYAVGWAEAWPISQHRQWHEWAAIAGIGITATVFLAAGLSIFNSRRKPPA
jgi:hypothetical protein